MNNIAKIFILLLFLIPGIAWGSFGITPPYVKNYELEAGDVHEQRIFIVRRDPAEDMNVAIRWEVPGADDWLSVDRGSEFILPAGEQKVPIIVTVRVPDDAFSGEYNGSLYIVVSPRNGNEARSGTVSVGMGAKAKVELSVEGLPAPPPGEVSVNLLGKIYADNKELFAASALLVIIAGAMFFTRRLILGRRS